MGRLRTPVAKTPPDGHCPCGSGRDYGDCCGPFLAGSAVPETAEQLMRSRYTAHVRGDRDWLRATWHPVTRRSRIDLDPGVRWMGLQILATEGGGPADAKGTVEFVAHYKIGGKAQRLHERSRFQRRNGTWLYLDGDLDPDPGSGPRDPKRGDDPSRASG